MLLKCEQLRIDRAGELLLEQLSLEVEAKSLALVGDFSALFQVLCGRAQVTSGSYQIEGHEAHSAVTRGLVGVALSAAVRQPRWTARELLTKSAQLSGLGGAGARARADAVLGRLGLQTLSARRLGELGHVELTALELAQATLTDPLVIAAESPFRDLSPTAVDWLWSVMQGAAEGRRLIVSFDTPWFGPSPLLNRFERLALLEHGNLVTVGSAAELLQPNSYLVSVTRAADRLRQALEARGCRVSTAPGETDGPRQLLVSGDAEQLARLIAESADAEGVPVIELVPLPRALQDDRSQVPGAERAM